MTRLMSGVRELLLVVWDNLRHWWHVRRRARSYDYVSDSVRRRLLREPGEWRGD